MRANKKPSRSEFSWHHKNEKRARKPFFNVQISSGFFKAPGETQPKQSQTSESQ